VKAAINRPALGSFPPVQWAQWLNEGLMTAAPKGLDQLITTLCGSSANGECASLASPQRLRWHILTDAETAFKCAFITYRARERGIGADFSKEDMGEVGSPQLWHG
jgi:4-aminobutyrate aminotransferase/(S)-3-amino-2-methylpropionate transaminase